jgi:hypothetical protein
VLLDVDDVALGHVTKLRWNESGKWIWSEQWDRSLVFRQWATDRTPLISGCGCY